MITRPAMAQAPPNAQLNQRVLRLFDREIQFIPNRKFRSMREDDCVALAENDPDQRAAGGRHELASALGTRMPAHLERLCESPLLTPEQEQELFCRMNFLRYRASELRAALKHDRPTMQKVVRIEKLLSAATETRNRIIHANIRLIISIVKQFADEKNRFDDLLSEGISCLIKAVDKFDVARGFRFSTYATRAVRREVFRLVQRHHRDRSRYSTGTEEVLKQELNRSLTPAGTEMTWDKLNNCINCLLDGLDDREKFIVEARYRFDDIGEKPTFQRLGQLLGVSKERVRQIEQRALGKLRHRAEGLRLEPVG